LRATEHEELRQIAEFGLNSMTVGFRTGIMTALIEIGNGDAVSLRKRAVRTLNLVHGLRSQIEGDKRVAAYDTNPFGVHVAIRGTLGPALGDLAAVSIWRP